MAKKRYHQSVSDRMAESRGEERRLIKDVGPEYYAGYDPRRKQERMDASMISEDHNAPANLPQNVVMKPWPMERGYTPEVLDDTIGGIDAQMDADNGQKMRQFKPHKY